MFETSKRLQDIPPYLFVEIDKKKKQLIREGYDVINFGVGDPDLPTPEHIVKAMEKAVRNPQNYRYPLGRGTLFFRKAISDYYRNNYEAILDPEEEICVLIGSKEGIAHFPLAFLNPGDVALIPEPAYPVYRIGTLLSGATPFFLPLKETNGYLPDFKNIPDEILSNSKIMYLNYPNNPTSAFAPKDFLEEAIAFCKKNNLIILYDAAYSEIYFEKKPVSFLSLPGAKEVGIEFNSLSKTYNMTGWRIGWACGNKNLVSALAKVKENIDSGTFEAIQSAGVEALNGPQECVQEIRNIYRRRRDIFAEGLKKIGWNVSLPEGTFYFWVKSPNGNSMQTVDVLLEKSKIVATPGTGFGPSGEGYIRFSLTIPEKRIEETIKRMEEIWRKK